MDGAHSLTAPDWQEMELENGNSKLKPRKSTVDSRFRGNDNYEAGRHRRYRMMYTPVACLQAMDSRFRPKNAEWSTTGS